jgi:mannose-6-phosphate isomerase-like protein (cupin superfamily)|tara:strand:+ start:5073 stop:5750 length:678 start_codon:yes stop_codon:yes gene_type:complete
MRREYDLLKDEKWLGHYDPTLSREWKAILLVSLHGESVDEESQRGADDYTKMKRTKIVEKLPYFEEILDAFKCRQGRVRILKLSPGAGINMHRDIRHEAANIAVGRVRLHIPIHTNDRVTFFVGGEKIKMLPGRLYYVNFSKLHYVRNEGETDRLHLVLDLEVNDWLRDIFPSMSVLERIESTMYKYILPIQWDLIKVHGKLRGIAWNLYKDSFIRQLRHKYFPK